MQLDPTSAGSSSNYQVQVILLHAVAAYLSNGLLSAAEFATCATACFSAHKH